MACRQRKKRHAAAPHLVSRVAWDNFRTGEESLKIAAELAMQAAVGRAVGLEQLYFFAYYELKEGNKTFGFLAPDPDAAPFVRRVPAERPSSRPHPVRRQAPDREPDDPFRPCLHGDRGCVTVLETAGGGTFAPPYPVCRVEGLDGRVIAGNADGSVPLPDPVVYLLSDTVPEELLDTGTPETAWPRLAGLPAPDRTPPSPLVLFPHPDFQAISPLQFRRRLYDCGGNSGPGRSRHLESPPPRRRRRSSPSTPGLCWLRGKPHNPSSCRPAAKSGWISRS